MPPATYSSSDTINKYSPLTGLVYVFNLIVGTGALTLPGAFSRAGWGLGLAFILILAFISFITVTFIIESMAIANALLCKKRNEKELEESSSESSRSRLIQSSTSRRGIRERDPLIPPDFHRSEELHSNEFEITQRVELGRMASMLFGKCGLYLFYLCIAVYLYGDLAIYITAVAKSLRDVSCTYVPPHNGTNGTATALIPDTDFCWSNADGMTRFGAYRLYSVLFLITLGPFCFFNVSKTKYLQLFTSAMRWTAFLIMIGLASKRLISGQGTGHPVVAEISALPNLFGICVYSFMCHHSLPSLVTPINSKKSIYSLFSADYLLITVFYLLLALTGIFAFDTIQDLYTLNFEPPHSSTEPQPILRLITQYFLSLFPVFTLSTNFPIIAITLRNNLKSLFHIIDEEDEELSDESTSEDEAGRLGYPNLTGSTAQIPNAILSRGPTTICCKLLSKAGFPLLAILPPFIIAMLVEDVQFLVSVTGSYAGAGIQYFIPVFLVYQARKRISPSSSNPYASPFRHIVWIWFVLAWSILSISFVTVHRFMNSDSGPPE